MCQFWVGFLAPARAGPSQTRKETIDFSFLQVMSLKPLFYFPSIKTEKIMELGRKKRKFKTNIFLSKKSFLEYVIKSLYGSVRVPSGF